ncbi:CAF1 family ribonuclease [Blastomyces dermatitidis ER-3]|uniref:CAF1 family ribonuclease n=1 Tax=Ajellomyces dermatitidis (strain ER-3 / ATCC MYA-2586) TaxID=559297 RepID=A0ABX2VSH1_AJEDR|nr:CAF1 family ribonuclease [Blastomyces dermatitidis ER-3]OAS99760.1 CAF1 family ribonuclease [Blastomyces dermatitidis ER-3]
MDVTRQSFSQHLPRLLNDLAKSSFVAVDLEFSGIVPRQSAPSPGSNLWGEKQTLQTRYEEVKEAADTYQVLQIGLTFAMEDGETGTYVLRPYNLHINPVLDERLGVERRWSYQSRAVEFLIKNGFRMEAPFVEGLPYLSRLEEQLAMTKLAESENSTAKIADIKPENMDPESHTFVAKVRGLIDSWIDEIGDKEEYLNIPEPGGLENGNMAGPLGSWRFALNSYQKRLVHQLVRAEYPSLVSISRKTFVQIIPYNKQREEYIRVDKWRTLRERIVQQMGFRWIVEGMVGGDLSAMDPRVFLPCIPDSATVDAEALSNYSDDLRSKLKSRQPVLVGHNLFTDLINFYKCFIGNLPDRIEDFKEAIHSLFPLVIDTKYMATHNCSSVTPSSSLAEINDNLAMRKTPKIFIDPEHDKYVGQKPLHEAGYDSLLTAKVLIKLTAELQGEAPIANVPRPCIAQPVVLDDWPRAPLRTASRMRSRVENKAKKLIDIGEPDCSDSQSFSSSTSIFDRRSSSELVAISTPKQSPVDWSTESEVSRIRSLLSTPTQSEPLAGRTHGTDKSQPPFMDPSSPFWKLQERAMIQHKRKRARLIPQFLDDFWGIYGNKLRVFGTLEEICDLN